MVNKQKRKELLEAARNILLEFTSSILIIAEFTEEDGAYDGNVCQITTGGIVAKHGLAKIALDRAVRDMAQRDGEAMAQDDEEDEE